MKSTDYVFGAALAAVALTGMPGIFEAKAHGAVVAGFTFESDTAFFPSSGTSSNASGTFTLYSGFTAASVGPISAQSGTGSAYGVHAASTTAYSTPAGNGSPRSLSSNTWASGDYYQFTVKTTGFEDLLISFDQTASSTGPKNFALTYDTGAGASTFTSYVVGATGFSAGSSTTAVTFNFNLSAISAIENVSAATFRLVNSDSPAAGGTNRVDNFIVNGTAVSGVPEPVSLSLMAGASTMLLGRRRKA